MSFKRRMRALPLSKIKMTDSFWRRWQDTLVSVTLPTQFEHLVRTGRVANFERAATGAEGSFQGLWFNDSDVYKFAEACAYALTVRDDANVRGFLTTVTDAIEAAQEPDGYINTYFQLQHPKMKWRNLHMMHEMYCGGHLIEAGVAAFECLGDRRLLEIGTRFADCVATIFGPGKRAGYCGHEEFELALLRLGRVTGNSKYIDLARWMVESRGQRPSPLEAEFEDAESYAIFPHTRGQFFKGDVYSGEYSQDHSPIRRHTEVVGHAVRAMYFYEAAAELADGRNDRELEDALVKVWNNLTTRRMYVTGGIGPSASNEGFTVDYDLPNMSAYAETCASCGLVFWGQKMLEVTGNTEYADVVERALYNGVLSGISISGDRYFYANPLESRGTHNRSPWFECACCPPNIARLIGSVGAYVAGASDDSFYVHIPAGFEATAIMVGTPVNLRVESDYPWSGKIKIHVWPERPVDFGLYVRIPQWSEEMESDLPGASEEAEYDSGYAVFKRIWRAGDVLSIDFGMAPRWVEANPRVRDNLGRVALTCGPLVYAIEEHDLERAPQLFSADIFAEISAGSKESWSNAVSLTASGNVELEDELEELYRPTGDIATEEASAKFIPYYAWNNRGPNSMQVWVRKG